ncbi:MAG TPA: aspartyl/asparaginyl beta-hydroxylase domain-containing protein [Casimicrobiaceae bacterium]|nr:aspartyl/asparaginyl beta-hydroxylase domain-containing protein [Casimicrobiaceae bacterium]
MNEAEDRRIRQIFESASQAFANGRGEAAERMLQQAEAEAPAHPLVQNRIAGRMLMSGDAAGAARVLELAVKSEPSNPMLWLNLAMALRELKRTDDELAALDKVLGIDPMHVRAHLQKAALHENRGEPRLAAMSYRTAVRLVPEGFEPPPQLRAILQHARDAVAANDVALEVFLEDRIKVLREKYSGESLGRFDRCLDTLLRKRKIFTHQPTFMYFPYLPSIEFYDRADFPWLDTIEAATDDIREELLGVLADGPESIVPYVSHPEGAAGIFKELNNSRRWGIYYLWNQGVPDKAHLERCPRTAKALEAWPKCDVPGSSPSAVFSILDAKTRIPPHSGVSNTRLLVHLPLIIPPGCRLRCGAETREWIPGTAFIFDDTIEHEAWNDSDVPRAVMIFDIWNPLLSQAERDLVRATTTGVGEYYGIQTYDGN